MARRRRDEMPEAPEAQDDGRPVTASDLVDPRVRLHPQTPATADPEALLEWAKVHAPHLVRTPDDALAQRATMARLKARRHRLRQERGL